MQDKISKLEKQNAELKAALRNLFYYRLPNHQKLSDYLIEIEDDGLFNTIYLLLNENPIS